MSLLYGSSSMSVTQTLQKNRRRIVILLVQKALSLKKYLKRIVTFWKQSFKKKSDLATPKILQYNYCYYYFFYLILN